MISLCVWKQEAEFSPFCACLPVGAIRNLHNTLWVEEMLRNEDCPWRRWSTSTRIICTFLKSLFFCHTSDVQWKHNAMGATCNIYTAFFLLMLNCLTEYWYTCLPTQKSSVRILLPNTKLTEMGMQKLGPSADSLWETVMRPLKWWWPILFLVSTILTW